MAHLEVAEWRDIQNILRQTFEIWSPGLTRDKYLEFIWLQMQHPWTRSNYQHLMLRDKERSKTALASMKYYNINMASRGRTYKFAGFGAIYSRKDVRGQGYGSRLIDLCIDKAHGDGCQGIMLFCDIDPSYYTRFGFVDMSNEKFFLALSDEAFESKAPLSDTSSGGGTGTTLVTTSGGASGRAAVTKSDGVSGATGAAGSDDASRMTGATSSDDILATIPGTAAHHDIHLDSDFDTLIQYRFLDTNPDTVDFVARHYMRWLRRRPFGVERSNLYFHFKIFRENFLAEHSQLSWPRIELVTINREMASGYAIIEYGGRVVRILELVGDDETRRLLWIGIIRRARQLDAIRISGWESILFDLMPGFSLAQFETIDSSLTRSMRTLLFLDKTRGRSMILPLCKEVEIWPSVIPNPILEFDHL